MNKTKAPTRRKRARQPVAGGPDMRRYVLVSLGIHFVVFLLIYVPLIQPPRPIYADPIYNVALVEWPEPNYQPPKPARTPREKREPERPKPTPKVEDAVAIPEKPKPKPQPKEPEPRTKPEETPVREAPVEVDLPNVPEEPVSLGDVDQHDFKHDYYLEIVRARLAQAWEPPRGGTGVVVVTVHFRIQRDGVIVDPEIVNPSGWSLYDRAGLGALHRVRTLPPLPEAYSGDHLGLTVNFRKMGDQP
jgi:protein TonB